ncbi:sodium:solute symporter family protein [Luteirhabdus pelagi]|uniref:sodium:solute symporter family protein n=1 Tax=Luteirhabdus pelagi TaxID=2792783 RepID=UPI001939C045|nr:sodium:solute symporter family protein [Luteirhabdus pelagi]
MELATLDWGIILAFFAVFLIIGILVAKRSGKDSKEFFLSGRNMPWWLLGISMVATTFSADTPNLVTDIVRQNGISGNWVWWTFLITGMLTVFVYAKLWRRSQVLTDLQFYELRYSGKEAAFLRGFRALYLGVFFNVMIMASVCLAAIKIGGVLFNLEDWESVLYASVITVAYSSIGGLRGVIFTDFLQFIIAMIGSVWAAFYIINLPEIGGLENLLAHENVVDKLQFLPDFNNTESVLVLLIIPLAVQWWSVWYPGAEPGGGGYIAQRMLSAKDEKNAIGATLLFNVAHYALRPWPWILIALASLVLYPQLSDIGKEFPNAVLGHDLGYPAMLTNLPAGLLGLVVASLVAAFMSTISTHLNWGSSYVSLDFYQRFVKPEASEKELVAVGRISTIVLMIFAALIALALRDALSTFAILLQIGAGTGLIFILRWFWWRVNAYSEITGMVVSFVVALLFEFTEFGSGFEDYEKLVIGVAITTVSWITVTLLTRPTDTKVLAQFYNAIKPYGHGWKGFRNIAEKEGVKMGNSSDSFTIDFASMLLAIVFVYTSLFATGYFIYGNMIGGSILLTVAAISGYFVFYLWQKGKKRQRTES